MGLKHIMNMKKSNKIVKKFISNVPSSDYEFNRFDKRSLLEGTNVESWTVCTTPNTLWDEASTVLWEEISSKYLSGESDLFCFVSSPYWQKDSKLVRYHGLAKFLQKEHKFNNIDLDLESYTEIDDDVLFYGVVKVDIGNFNDILNLLSKLESGLLFTWDNQQGDNFDKLVEQLTNTLLSKSKSLTNYLNAPIAINQILDKGIKAFYIYSWPETGDNQLDIFSLD